MNLLHKIVVKLFVHLLHKSVVFDNKGIVYEFVTTECCLFKLFMNLLHKIVFKLFMHLLHMSVVFDNEVNVYKLVTTECCL
jgi:hypothetical protein